MAEIEDRAASHVLQQSALVHVKRAEFEILPDPQNHPECHCQPGQVLARQLQVPRAGDPAEPPLKSRPTAGLFGWSAIHHRCLSVMLGPRENGVEPYPTHPARGKSRLSGSIRPIILQY